MRGPSLLLAAALVLTPGGIPLGGTCARAEILILKDGRRVPCRVLLQNEKEVTVREAGGTEVTYERRQITRVDPSVSSVEIYEAVLENLTPGVGLVPFHLMRWCGEQGLKIDSKRLLEMAARDPLVRGRVYLARAAVAQSEAEKRRLLTKAVYADPTLAEAVDPLCEIESAPSEIPHRLIVSMVDLARNLIDGEPSPAAAALTRIKSHPDARSREELSRRLFHFTGLSFTEVTERLRGHPPSREAQGTSDSEKGSCPACGGSGYRRCDMCGGQGFISCQKCGGQGTVKARRRISARGRVTTVTTFSRCAICKGGGGRDCPLCLRRDSGPVTRTKTLRVSGHCGFCKGSGTRLTGTTSTTLSGRTYTRKILCRHCNGAGTESATESARFRITGSGVRRCGRCNKDGHIPLESPEAAGEAAPPVPRGRTGERAKRLSLDREELQRLSEFLQLVKLAKEGKHDLRWRAGAKVPFKLAHGTRHTTGDVLVFARGRWCTPSMKKLVVQQAKNVGHDPRPVDVSEFRDWMIARELKYLRSHSWPSHLGGKAAADVRAFVRLCEDARRLARPGDAESGRLMRTTFAPVAPGPGQAQEPFVATGFRLVLLRDSKGWPDLEVVVRPSEAAKSGFDLRPVQRAFASLPGRLTLFYRVKMVERRAERPGAGARARVSLFAHVYAATLGLPEKPRRVWVRGIPAR